MTWTDTEWEAFAGLLEEGWPGAFEDSTSDAWRVLLAGAEPSAAVLALRRLLLEGRRFRPSASELLAELRRDPSRPTFDEMLFLLRQAMSARDPLAGVEALHPLVRGFVRRQGWDRLRTLPLDDPDWGERTRRDLKAAWDWHVEAFDGREIAAIAAGGTGELKRLDPLAALPGLSA